MPDLPVGFLDAARACLAESDILLDPVAIAPFLLEQRGLHHGVAEAVFQPRDTAGVSRLVALAAQFDVPVVALGGNTGLVGGGVAFGGVILSLAKMNRIRTVDVANAALVAEAGTVLQSVQDAADAAGLLFPLSLGSEGSCTIGGNIATNAGGTGVLRYGNMRSGARG
jgi:FAD/FMN-containing dehydrogenase